MFKKRHSLEKSRTMMLQSNIVDQPPKSDTEVDPGAAEEDKDDFYGTVWKGVRGLLSGRGAGSEDTPQQKQHRNFSNTSAEGFYITVGAGYRFFCLL
jgi:hypothetical protein